MIDPVRRAHNCELVDRLATASVAERDELVERLVLDNMDVARSIARRYAGRSQFGPDLEQAVYLALFRAAQDFDASRGHEFLAYAVPCMTGAAKRFFRDSAWMIRPPRPIQQQHSATEGLHDHVVQGVAVETYFRPHSLDLVRPGDTETVGAGLVDDADRAWEQTEARLLLWPHLRNLPPHARRVLHLRFFEDRTQQQIADELGVTQFHVSRLLRRYLGELRQLLLEAA